MKAKLALIGAINNRDRRKNYEVCLLEEMKEHGHTWTGWTFPIKKDNRKILEEYISKGEPFSLYFYMSKLGGGSGLVEYRLVIDRFRYDDNGVAPPDPEICCEDDLAQHWKTIFHVKSVEKLDPPLSLENFRRWDNPSLKARPRPLQNTFEFVNDIIEPKERQRKWWIEKTHVKGRPDRESGDYALGMALWSPQKDKRGAKIYEKMKHIRKGDIIIHFVDNEHIVGISVVDRECDDSFTCLPRTKWDNGTGKRPGYLIRLKDYQPLPSSIKKEEILNDKNKDKLLSLLKKYKNLFYNSNLRIGQGGYITEAPPELVFLINEIHRAKTGTDLPYFSAQQPKAPETLNLLYKIAWHPGGYKGGFCGNANAKECEAFKYIKDEKAKKPCSRGVYHCIDEHKAFAEDEWRVTVHPPRRKKLNELSEGSSLLFLVAPLNRPKTLYRLVGFYTVKQKILKNGEVEEIIAEKSLSSKFDLKADELKYSSKELKSLFGFERWSDPYSSYEFISTDIAVKVLKELYDKHKQKKIIDPDINLVAMEKVIERLQQPEIEKEAKLTFYEYLLSHGFLFNEQTASAFYTALKTKGFIILAGLTGTGKTKLPQLFCELVADNSHYLFMPVRPDWRDSKPLLGYYNSINYKYMSTGLLNLILNANAEWRDKEKKSCPFFVILDEMNLSRVEYYFADFLSVLESGRGEKDLLTRESIVLHETGDKCKTNDGKEIPSRIKLPPNLYFIGTVNLDETTYSFSPKVLDRAFVVEFWDVDLRKYPSNTGRSFTDASKNRLKQLILDDLSRNGKCLKYDKQDIVEAIKELGDFYNVDLKNLHNILQEFGLHFGYRVVDEIALFYKNAKESMNKGIIKFESHEQILDYAVLMKILPKIHGNRSKVEIPLYRILTWAIDSRQFDEVMKSLQEESGRIKNEYLEALARGPKEFVNKLLGGQKARFPLTVEKVARMLYQLYSTGFTSFL